MPCMGNSSSAWGTVVPDTITVEVVYADGSHCVSMTLRVAAGESVADIVRRCGILAQCPASVDPLRGKGAIGIFGECVSQDAVPADGDRIEIYRPLERHPMEARRGRAQSRSTS